MRIFLFAFAALFAGALLPDAAAGQRWVAVDVGFLHACALDDGGRAYCWGENGSGELGGPTPARCREDHGHGHGAPCGPGPSAAPVAVRGGLRFRAIRAGYADTCGVTTKGKLFCWGIPWGLRAPGPTPFAPERTFHGVEETDRTICGLETGGGARCWMHRGEWREEAFLPGVTLTALDLTGWPAEVTCAVDAGGRARCRGDNRYGQVGAPGDSATFAEVAGGIAFTVVRTADMWTCGLSTGGEAYCWGVARAGEIPPAERRADAPDQCGGVWCRRAPARVAEGRRFRALDRGKDEMCGLTNAGEVFCWMYDGMAVPSAAGTRFRAISGGYHEWCGITVAGALACWAWDKPAPPVPVPPPAAAAPAG